MQHRNAYKVGCHSGGCPQRCRDTSLFPDTTECGTKACPCVGDVVYCSQFQTAYKRPWNRNLLGKEDQDSCIELDEARHWCISKEIANTPCKTLVVMRSAPRAKNQSSWAWTGESNGVPSDIYKTRWAWYVLWPICHATHNMCVQKMIHFRFSRDFSSESSRTLGWWDIACIGLQEQQLTYQTKSLAAALWDAGLMSDENH
jgi:hypothetical protein